MKPLDARTLTDSTRIDADVCVVGGGIAGLVLAGELSRAGRDVCVLEAGGLIVDEATQELYGLESVGYPTRANFMSRARYLGGSSNLWAGRSMRLDPIDFSPREWVPNSGWPLSAAELGAYYPKAERVLGLPSTEQMQARFLNDARRADSSLAVFDDSELQPKVITWGRRPLRAQRDLAQRLAGARNLRLLLNANVTELVTNENGTHVESVAVATLTGVRFQVHAKQFVLACGGIENARLLLVSRGRQSTGIGNSHDLVGRYFMDHPRAIMGTVKLRKPLGSSTLLGVPVSDGKVQIGIGLSDQSQARERALNSYLALEPRMSELTQKVYGHSANTVKVLMRKGYAGKRSGALKADMPEMRDLVYVLTPKEVMPHWMYRVYARLQALKQRVRKIHDLTIINFCEQVPRHASRVYLGTERDQLGLPKLVLDWKIGSEETHSMLRLQDALAKRLVTSGIGELSRQDIQAEPSYTDASHHMGTTRMNDNPKEGVVDRHCRVHGVDNLHIAGSSVFPTVGCANPTLTIVGLTLRLAERLNARQSGAQAA